MNRQLRKIAILLLLLPTAGAMAATTINQISYEQEGERSYLVKIGYQGDKPEPGSFSVESPASIAIDFPGATLAVAEKNLRISSSELKNVRAVEAGGRSRIIINMGKLLPYTISHQLGQVTITLSESIATSSDSSHMVSVANTGSGYQMSETIQSGAVVSAIDFRRGGAGEAKIAIKLTDANSVVEIEQRGKQIFLSLPDTPIKAELEQQLDVIDFATPAATIEAKSSGEGSEITITAINENFDYMGYQIGDSFMVEMTPLTPEKLAEKKKDVGFSGEKLSLNFQNIEVRAVLQLLADFTGKNVVVSDTVSGSVTLRLKNVPWDQALDIILSSRGLGMRENGNVIMVAPSAEITAREKEQLESLKQIEDLSPLYTKFFRINYAKAADIQTLFGGTQSTDPTKADNSSLLSARGRVSVDERTNTLLVIETAEKLNAIEEFIKKVDIPVDQVMIEGRVVVASDTFSHSLGIQTGLTKAGVVGGNMVGTTGDVGGANSLITTNSLFGSNRLNVALPAGNPAGRVGMAILGSDYLVDLELSAMQSEGRGEVVASPRLITMDKKAANITSGVNIMTSGTAENGGTITQWTTAALTLTVTPQITPDESVIMSLTITKDAPVGNNIDTKSINTEVLVKNGDTVVLGGVFEESRSNSETKVPLLGDIPILGALFRSRGHDNNKSELLIFVTPKILSQDIKSTFNSAGK
ncbi:MAG: type IV pilus secretin PilQ [Gammaproteobacteria bacterium]|nr:type IV pilus secretin PilQ [Gammaproteobacteria bacterium]